MKFFIAICMLASVASAMNLDMKKESSAEMSSKVTGVKNATQCIYKAEDSHMSCKMGDDTIECPTVHEDENLGGKDFKIPEDWNVWGIGKAMTEGKKDGEIKSVKYMLYPRKLNASIYFKPFKMMGENKVSFVMGCGKKTFDTKSNLAGLRVQDCMCFERMSNMIKHALEKPHAAMVNMEQGEEKIELAGEMLVMDKQIRKRWLFGWGWGMGLGLGWGFGGLGWGFPFWG